MNNKLSIKNLYLEKVTCIKYTHLLSPVDKLTFLLILDDTNFKYNKNNCDFIDTLYNNYVLSFGEYVDKFITNKLYFKKIRTISTLFGFCNTCTNIQYYIDRGYSIIESRDILKSRQSTMSLTNIMKSHDVDIEEAKIIKNNRTQKAHNTIKNRNDYDVVCFNRGNGNRVEYYLDKINPKTNVLYTNEEAYEKIYNKQKIGLDNFWRDVKAGTKNYLHPRTLEYFIAKGLSLENAEIALKDIQTTFSLSKCIARYGEYEGTEIWQNRQSKWQNTQNNKSEEEKQRILIAKTKGNKFYSNASQKFINKVIAFLPSDLTFLYGDKEYFIYYNKNIYFYDLFIPELKIIIEYNGSHVHPSKEKLSVEEWHKWQNPFTKKNSDYCYNRDQMKKHAALENNIQCIEFWDYDDNIIEIQKLCNLINEEYICKILNV